ncbi:MAG: class I SAM-dependent methyltransferase [bacterium]
MSNLIENTNCPICGPSPTKETGWEYTFQNIKMPLVKCQSCQLVRLNPRPNSDGLAKLYDDSYFDSGWDCGCTGKTYVEAGGYLLKVYENVIEEIKHYKAKGDLLDIGCAGGYFLKVAQESGYTVKGIELNKKMVEHARKSLGLDVTHGHFKPGLYKPNSFDIIHLGDVLEHVQDPMATVLTAFRILRPGGVLFISAPLSYGMSDPKEKPMAINIPPYHIFEFTPTTLSHLVKKAGFKLVGYHLAPLDGTGSFIKTGLLKASKYIPRLAKRAERIDLVAIANK